VAVDVPDQEQDIWIWDLMRQTLTRLTFDAAGDLYPVWTPDGRRLAFSSGRAGVNNLYWQAADGTGVVDRLTESPHQQFPYAFTRDGTRLVLREDGPGTGNNLAVLPLEGERRLAPLVDTTFNERNAELSPDGRWLTYDSNESGREEIYVRPFPDVDGGRWQVSTGGGTRPLWAPSGRELFYLTLDGALMGVSVERIDGTSGFTAGAPTKLVEGRYFSGGGGVGGRTYDVSPDGRRFLMVKEGDGGADSAASPTIVIVQHWAEELKRLVPRN